MAAKTIVNNATKIKINTFSNNELIFINNYFYLFTKFILSKQMSFALILEEFADYKNKHFREKFPPKFDHFNYYIKIITVKTNVLSLIIEARLSYTQTLTARKSL